MYTKLDDWCHAHKVNELLRSNPSMMQKELCELLVTNYYRLKYLQQQGLINIQHTKRRFTNDAKNT